MRTKYFGIFFFFFPFQTTSVHCSWQGGSPAVAGTNAQVQEEGLSAWAMMALGKEGWAGRTFQTGNFSLISASPICPKRKSDGSGLFLETTWPQSMDLEHWLSWRECDLAFSCGTGAVEWMILLWGKKPKLAVIIFFLYIPYCSFWQLPTCLNYLPINEFAGNYQPIFRLIASPLRTFPIFFSRSLQQLVVSVRCSTWYASF